MEETLMAGKENLPSSPGYSIIMPSIPLFLARDEKKRNFCDCFIKLPHRENC